MILGIGVDLIEPSRIQDAFDRHGDRFKKRIYTDVEIAYCESMASPRLHFAARWAAKEAFAKALGLGVAQGIAWKEIGIRNDEHGAPHLELTGHAARLAAQRGTWAVHVSLSHSDTACAAVVVLEGERPEDSPLPPQ